MIELLSVYTYKGMHNFLFPLASDGNLAKLLDNERTENYKSNEGILAALAGLSSAICAIHEYSSENLRAIGCHHDVKPSNILVNESDFILADFGLSRLKESYLSSATVPKNARGNYLAPECEDLEADCEKGIVHRSADIWSFGCIIAELLTYMIEGRNGVQKFEESRAFIVRGLKLWRFHCGSGKPSKAVADWMERIKSKCRGPEQQLVPLVEDMLAINPEDRPRAPETKRRLCAIALDAVTQPIDHLFRIVSRKSQSIQVFVEQRKFASWRQAYELALIEKKLDLGRSFERISQYSFQSIVKNLHGLRDTLELIDSNYQGSKSLFPLQLRKVNEYLFEMLPQGLQNEGKSLWERSLLETADDDLLKQVSDKLSVADPESNIGALAAIKRMSILVEQRSHKKGALFLNPECLKDQKDLESFTTEIISPDRKSADPVLVEQKRVDMHKKDDPKGDEVLNRLEEVAKVVNCAASHDSLQVLHCRGVFHDEANSSFGMVYDFPESSTPKIDLRATTLTAALKRTTPGNQSLPLLGEQYHLAHALAAALSQFHTIGWLHKSISSETINFIHPHDQPWTVHMQNWYLRGFLHSRLIESALTEGLTSNPELMNYHHPEYLSGLKEGSWWYQSSFDHYSLGIVMLEIGLWRSLGEIIGKWKGRPEALREKLLRSAVPSLGSKAGRIYRDAVAYCLNRGFADVEGEDCAAEFKAHVVDQLAKCRA